VSRVDEYQFGVEFEDLRADPGRAGRLARELAAELSSGHALLGQAYTVVACARQGGYVVVTTDSAVYLVLLAGISRPKQPPWWTVRAFHSVAEFEDAMTRLWTCDWCHAPITESAWQGSVSLGLDGEDAWACDSCLALHQYHWPPEFWVEPDDDWPFFVRWSR
jgi:hypothetical protein